MDMGLGFLGEYITAAEIVGKTPTLTISKVTLEKVESLKKDDGETGKMKDRIIVYFAEGKSGRGWLLNRTNAECLRALYNSRETNDWLGKRVTLMAQNVRVGPKMEPGIRVKGSPDITEPITFELRLPRKRPIQTTLLPTGAKPAAKPPAEPERPSLLKTLETCTDVDALDEAASMIGTLAEADQVEAKRIYTERRAELEQ
ncbi:MAG: hypothetical protein ACK52V_04650 [Betaproteobacteria bacterium]